MSFHVLITVLSPNNIPIETKALPRLARTGNKSMNYFMERISGNSPVT